MENVMRRSDEEEERERWKNYVQRSFIICICHVISFVIKRWRISCACRNALWWLLKRDKV